MSFETMNVVNNPHSNHASIPPQIIIWIHGTRSHDIFPPTHVVKKSPSIDTQPIQHAAAYSPLGLHSLVSIDQDLHVSMIAQAMYEADATLYSQEHIYLFGWSGGCTPEARTTAGTHLYQELKELSFYYRHQYATTTCPPITIVAHSHGGNVALECAALHTEDITIERLILLACPVQEKTKPYMLSSLFKHIYSIYSDKDYFQILDMQGLHPMWEALDVALKSSSLEPIKNAWRTHKRPTKLLSERIFPEQPNLKQACIKWHKTTSKWSAKDLCIMEPFLSKENIQKLQKKLQDYDQKERSLMHIEFLFPSFLQHLPQIINTLDTTSLSHTDTKRTLVIKI